MSSESDRLRAAVRTQEAIIRTVTDELQREAPDAQGLRDQALAESARLVAAMQTLSRTRTQPPAGEHFPPSHPLAAGKGRRPRILLVDDDELARTAVASWLAHEYDVVTAGNGAEGLARARETLPDAVIADVEMPNMDGIAMVQRIREAPGAAFVPVLFLTAHSAPEKVTAGFSAGGVGYLVKPVDLDMLDEELRWALAGASADPR